MTCSEKYSQTSGLIYNKNESLIVVEVPPKSWIKNQLFGGAFFMYRKHTFEEKLLAVQRYLNGEGSSKEIGRDLGLDHHDVIIYSLRYKRLGEDGLRRQPYVIATYEQKLDILRQYKENCISLDELSAQTGFGRSTLLKWLRISREKGYEALADVKQRGRPPKNMRKQSKPTESLTEIEKLQAELRYLKAENDLLKKVKALVEQREAQNRKIGRKPSKN